MTQIIPDVAKLLERCKKKKKSLRRNYTYIEIGKIKYINDINILTSFLSDK